MSEIGMDLEDGELPSSENEDEGPQLENTSNLVEIPEDEDYVIMERPKSSFPGSLMSSAVIRGDEGSFQAENPKCTSSDLSVLQGPIPDILTSSNNTGSSGKKSYYNNLGFSDLLDSPGEDESSSATSDSDEGGHPLGKRYRMAAQLQQPFTSNYSSNGSTSFSNPVSSHNSTQLGESLPNSSENDFSHAAEAFRAEAEKFQKQRKPNLVWSNVIQEEQISNIFDRVKVAEPGFADVEVTRGPETYSYQRPMRQPRPRRPSDSSDISSEGLSDNALYYLRDGFSFDDETEESSEHSLPKSFTSSSVTRSVASRKATKGRRDRQKYKRKLINKLKKMKAPDLAKYMAVKLTEEKSQLLCRAIEILGKENCIHTFLKTLKIERRGGVMVKNQERRRTAGGVFLYLIRGDRRFQKSQIDLIFREDRTFHDKVKKKKLVAKRLRKKAKLEAAKSSMEQAADMTDDDESDEDTAVPEMELMDPDGTDTGQLGDDSTQESSVHDKDTTDEHPFEMFCDPSDL